MSVSDMANSKLSSLLGPNEKNSSFKPRVNVDFDGLHNKFRWEYGFSAADPQVIQEIQKTLLLCDTEIALQIESQAIDAQAQKKRLYDYKTQLSSLLSPIRHIPNEILCLIFEFACTENFLQEYPWPSNLVVRPTEVASPVMTYLPALAISAVCKRWRDLGLVSNHLWSRLKLEILHVEENSELAETAPDMHASDTHGGFISTLQLYLRLDRSGNAPLFIDLQIMEFTDDTSSSPPILDLLLEHTQRWKMVKNTGDYTLLRSQHSFPDLRALTLEGIDDPLILVDFDCFRDAPKLCAITTSSGVQLLSNLSRDQLTCLDVDLDVGQMEDFRYFPNLTALTLRSQCEDEVLEGLVSLARLESLTITAGPYNADLLLEQVFSTFTLPSLTELVIYKQIFTSYEPVLPGKLSWSGRAFAAFLSRSTCSLTTLSISGVIISDMDLIITLRNLRSLLNLSVGDSALTENETPITPHFISSLSNSHSAALETPLNAPLLPKLRCLSIAFSGTSFNDAMFVNMVSSRWLPDTLSAEVVGIDCLRSVVLQFQNREVDEKVYRSLADLDSMGMRVVVAKKGSELTHSE